MSHSFRSEILLDRILSDAKNFRSVPSENLSNSDTNCNKIQPNSIESNVLDWRSNIQIVILMAKLEFPIIEIRRELRRGNKQPNSSNVILLHPLDLSGKLSNSNRKLSDVEILTLDNFLLEFDINESDEFPLDSIGRL